MIELNDGSEAFGKSVSGVSLCVRPVFWCFGGAQPRVYVQQLGSASYGRLRFVMLSLDRKQVQNIEFEEKFVPRRERWFHDCGADAVGAGSADCAASRGALVSAARGAFQQSSMPRGEEAAGGAAAESSAG